MRNTVALCAVLASVAAGSALAAPTRSSPLATAPSNVVFVVNPDSNTVGRLDFSSEPGTLTHEHAVGAYPRTLALDATHVFTAGQNDDSVWRLDQADLGNPVGPIDLGHGCNPYGVAVTPAGDRVVVTCQASNEVVLLDADLTVVARMKTTWPNPRAIAIASNGGKAYVSHYLTEEPDNNLHVTVLDLRNNAIETVFAVGPDTTTCETQNSGQGVLNLVSAIALIPDGAPADVANQLWVGGTQENNVSKGLFKREVDFKSMPGAALFPWVTFAAFPNNGANRNIYKASFHDITRFGIVKLDATSGALVGKLDIDEANNATDIEFSPDGSTAYVVDLMFNSYHIFNTRKGQGSDVTTLFAAPSAFGPGGADSSEPCVPDALRPIVGEGPFRLGPQAQISTIDGYDPVDTNNAVVLTGLDFDAAQFVATNEQKMRRVADGIGTSPIGVRLAGDGNSVFVANYLSRNVVRVASAQPVDGMGTPSNLRCIKGDFNRTCNTNNDCPASVGFCNHPGGAACTQESDCGGNGPCIRGADCVPLILGQPVWSITGDLTVDPSVDPLPAALLDGKNLFNTAARDSSVPNGVGLGSAAPLVNYPAFGCHYDDSKSCGTPQGAASFPCSFCANDPSRPCGGDTDCGGARCVNNDLVPKECSNNQASCVRDTDCTDGARCLPVIRFCSTDLSQQCTADNQCGDDGICAAHFRFCTNDATIDCTTDAQCGGGTCQSARCDVPKTIPGAIVSTSHDASYVTCSTCHADFGGQDGRTWDFAQFGASLRNTMDLRGRAGFAPGTCSNAPAQECFFDAACDDGDSTPDYCKANPAMIPPNVAPTDRDRWFNPMLTVHWNGDRDEVEDFEHTFRQLQGSGDCDAAEDVSTCMGALIQRSPLTSTDPADVSPDLGPPNRNISAGGKNVGVRLTHMADFVYSLTAFPRNPNVADEATERGRLIFSDPQTACTSCHLGGPGAGRQYFTDKKPNASFDAGQPGRADRNNPFVRHDVGTMNLFDGMDPGAISAKNQLYQNPRIPIPGNRGPLGDYVTPVLNDLWNTRPYLHDGSAHTLLDVVRPCDTTLDDCYAAGRGRNLNRLHGDTSMLTPQQLNDLVAFQNALTLATVVGNNERVIRAGALDLTSVSLRFPKKGKRARPNSGRVKLRGVLRGAPAPIDPAADGVIFTIATPGGDQMAIFTRTLSGHGKGKRVIGRSTEGGNVTVSLKPVQNGYRFTVKGKKLDLTALDVDRGDPKSRDLTVAFEISGTTFVKNRNLIRRKAVYALPRGRRGARLASASN